MTTGSALSPDPPPADGRLSLWWAPLDIAPSLLATLARSLSPGERARADEYGAAEDRDHFIAARGWLRRLLAGETGCAPSEVRFLLGENGKPEIESSDLRFNASRSAGTALYATSRTTDVGVDIEAIRPEAEVDIDGMAARFFSSSERRALAGLAPDQRLAASFQCWTYKEAYVKATGTGLRVPIDTVDVWAGDDRPTTVSGWTVQPIEMAPGFAAAVAGRDLLGWIPGPPGPVNAPD
jgi:4'-phosphopantetheinyl transferase